MGARVARFLNIDFFFFGVYVRNGKRKDKKCIYHRKTFIYLKIQDEKKISNYLMQAFYQKESYFLPY